MMKKLLLAATISLLSTQALAQYSEPPPPPPPMQGQDMVRPEAPKHHLALSIGWTGISNGYYCTAYYYYGCYDYYSLSFWPFTVRGSFDFGLSRTMSLNLGVDWMYGTYYNEGITIWQPTADIRWNFPAYGSRSRFYLGIGVPITERGDVGVAGRFGFGSTFMVSRTVGIALDLILGFGSISGYEVGTFAFLLGPEFGF